MGTGDGNEVGPGVGIVDGVVVGACVVGMTEVVGKSEGTGVGKL